MKEEKSLPKKALDALITVLNLPVNAAASLVDFVDDGRLDRPFLGNSFSAMYEDKLKREGKEPDFGDKALGFGLDILLDPTTYLTGGLGKLAKVDDALRIAKGANVISDVSAVAKAQNALDVIASTKKGLDLTSKAGKQAVKTLNAAENVLKAKNGGKIFEKVLKSNASKLITPATWQESGIGGALKRAFVSDDVALIPTQKLQKKAEALEKILKADYASELKQAATALEGLKPLEKGFSTLAGKGVKELAPGHIKSVIKISGGNALEAQNKFNKYLRAQETITRLVPKKEVELYGIKGLRQMIGAGSVNEVLKADEALELLAKKEAKANADSFAKLAKSNAMDGAEWNREMINFIETGSKGALNEASLAEADRVKKLFSTLREIDGAAMGKSISRITNGRYIPRVFTQKMAKADREKAFYQVALSAGKERATKGLTFLELQEGLAKQGGALLKEDLAELVNIAQRRTHERVKLAKLAEGVKAYVSKVPGKGLELIDHPIVNASKRAMKSPEEFIKALKQKGVKAEDLQKLKTLNWTALKAEMPALFGKEKAAELMRFAYEAQKAPAFLPKPVLDKLSPIITKNREYDTLGKKALSALRQYQQVWKKWTLAPIPVFHTNNYVDNLNRLVVHEPGAVFNLKKAVDLQGGKAVVLSTPFGKKSFILEDFIQGGITGGKYSIKEFQDLAEAAKQSSGFGKLIRGDIGALNKAFDFGNMLEDQSRLMLAVAELEKGRSMKDAVSRVMDIFYDSSRLTEAVKFGRDHVFPFLGFTFQNTKAGVKAFSKYPGRAMIPLKAVNASRMGEGDFIVKDELADGRTALRVRPGASISLSPKASQLEILDILDTVTDEKNTAKGILNALIGYSGPYRSLLEAAVNRDFRTGDLIDSKEEKEAGEKTEKFLGLEIGKRPMHIIKGHARLLRIINNALSDGEGNYAWDYLEEASAGRPLEVVASNLPSVFFGGTYNQNLQKAAQRAVREAGERVAVYQRDITEIRRRMAAAKNGEERLSLQHKMGRIQENILEERRNQQEIKSEYSKIAEEMRKIGMDKKEQKKFQSHIKGLFDGNIRAINKETEAEIINVLDGDSVVVRMPNGTTEWLRLAAIDAPDSRKREASTGLYKNLTDVQNEFYYKEAGRQLKAMLVGRRVKIKTAAKRGRDNYGRPLVRITAEGLDINKEMIARGLARPALRSELEKDYADEITKALNEAKKTKKGIWSVL